MNLYKLENRVSDRFHYGFYTGSGDRQSSLHRKWEQQIKVCQALSASSAKHSVEMVVPVTT